MLQLPPPNMLSVRIPFAGFYESTWDHEFNDWGTQQIDHWKECMKYDRERLNDDLGTHEMPDQIVQEILDHHVGEILGNCQSYRQYMDKFSRAYAEQFAWWLAETLDLTDGDNEPCTYSWVPSGKMWVAKLGIPYEYEELTSPPYYNFETDKLYVKLSEATLSRIYEELGEDARRKAFKDMFTSYDGFISFYENTPPTKPIADWDHNELYALLSARVKQQLDDWQSIDSALHEELYETRSNLTSEATDWDDLKVRVQEQAEEIMEELGILPEDLPPPRCPHTLELPL